MKIKSRLFYNFKYKITVLLLAVLVWFFVKTEDIYRYSFNVPVKIVNLSEDKIITNDLVKEIEVNFSGKGRSLLSLMLRKDISYILDVEKNSKTNSLPVDKSNILILRKNDIEVLNIIRPKNIALRIEKLTPKKVPIISNCKIETAPGYTIVGNIQLIPDSVMIRGPKENIDSIKFVNTEEKLFSTIKKDLSKKIRLIPFKNKNVMTDLSQIQFIADIQKLMEKPFMEIPVRIINCPANANISVIPSTMSIVLEGGTKQLLNLTKDDITAYIDYEKVRRSKDKKHVAYIVTPQGIRYRDAKPTRFKIVVTK